MKKRLKDVWKPMLIVAFLFILGSFLPNGKQILFYMAAVCLILLICFLAAMFLLDRYHKSKTPYMSDYLKTCDAKKFLEQCEQLERKKKADTDSYYALVQDLISAYLVNGDFASARKWLAYMESKQKLAGKYKENVKKLGVLCAVMENDYPRAARLIEDMRDMVRKKPKNKHLRQKLANAVLVLDARTGEQKVAKEYYEKLFTKGTRNLSEKIWCKYHLLAAYELEQNEDKIKECLVYLDQHGNNTYMAKIAREKRKSMDI